MSEAGKTGDTRKNAVNGGGVRGFVRYLVRPLYALPPLVFLLFRLVVGSFWLWGVAAKGPWDNWGCVRNGFCETGFLESLPSTLPGLAGQIAQSQVIPHILQIEYMALGIEIILTVSILLGIFGRFGSLAAVLWSLFVSGTYVFQPGAVIPDSLLFIVAQLVLLGVRGGALLTVDSLVQPRLAASPHRVLRQLGGWMWAPAEVPPQP